jgi:hypothetical protein
MAAATEEPSGELLGELIRKLQLRPPTEAAMMFVSPAQVAVLEPLAQKFVRASGTRTLS